MDNDQVDIDDLLERVLPCDTQTAYERQLMQWSLGVGRSRAKVLKNADRQLRRRVIRRTDYHPDSVKRQRRDGMAWTWVEDHLLDIAFGPPDPETLTPITASYIADLLQRTLTEVEQRLREKQEVKLGVRGLF